MSEENMIRRDLAAQGCTPESIDDYLEGLDEYPDANWNILCGDNPDLYLTPPVVDEGQGEAKKPEAAEESEETLYPTMDPDKKSVSYVADVRGKILPDYQNSGNKDIVSETDRVIESRVAELRGDAWGYSESQVDQMAEGLEKLLRRMPLETRVNYSPGSGADYGQMNNQICGRLGNFTTSEGKEKQEALDRQYPSMATSAAKERDFARACGLED